MALNLSKEKKDTYTIEPDPWGRYEVSSDNIEHSLFGNMHGVQCRNLKNSEVIRDKCGQVVKLIEEIEQLNK